MIVGWYGKLRNVGMIIALIVWGYGCSVFASQEDSKDHAGQVTPAGGCESAFDCPVDGYSCIARQCVKRGAKECTEHTPEERQGLDEARYQGRRTELISKVRNAASAMLDEQAQKVAAVQQRYQRPYAEVVHIATEQQPSDALHEASVSYAQTQLEQAEAQWLALVNQAEARRYLENNHELSSIASRIEIIANEYDGCVFDLRGLALEDKENFRDELETCVLDAADKAPEGSYVIELVPEWDLERNQILNQDPFHLLVTDAQLYDVAEHDIGLRTRERAALDGKEVMAFDACIDQNRLMQLGQALRMVAGQYRTSEAYMQSLMVPALDIPVSAQGGTSQKLYEVLNEQTTLETFFTYMQHVSGQVKGNIEGLRAKVQGYGDKEILELTLLEDVLIRAYPQADSELGLVIAQAQREAGAYSKGKQFVAAGAMAVGLLAVGLGGVGTVPLTLGLAAGAAGTALTAHDYYLAKRRFERVERFYQTGIDDSLSSWDIVRAEEAALASQLKLLAFDAGTFLIGDVVPLLYHARTLSRARVHGWMAQTGALSDELMARIAEELAARRSALTGLDIEAGDAPLMPAITATEVMPEGGWLPRMGAALCFEKGTPVWTDKGKRPIERIEVGDTVQSYDEAHKKFVLGKVTQKFVTKAQRLFALGFRDARTGLTETISATKEHPFYTKHKGWRKVSELKVGDKVLTFAEKELELISITQKPNLHTVYNFEVAEHHSYVVGQAGALVHNQCEAPTPSAFQTYVRRRVAQADAIMQNRIEAEASTASPIEPSATPRRAVDSAFGKERRAVPEFVYDVLGTLPEDVRARITPYWQNGLEASALADGLRGYGRGWLESMSDLGEIRARVSSSNKVGKNVSELADVAFETNLQHAVDQLTAAARALERSDANAPAYRFWVHKNGGSGAYKFNIQVVDFRQSLHNQVAKGEIFRGWSPGQHPKRIYLLELDALYTLDTLYAKLMALGPEPARINAGTLNGLHLDRLRGGRSTDMNWVLDWVQKVQELLPAHPLSEHARLYLTSAGGSRIQLTLSHRQVVGGVTSYDLERIWTALEEALLQERKYTMVQRSLASQEQMPQLLALLKARADEWVPGLGGQLEFASAGKVQWSLRWKDVAEAQRIAGLSN